MKGACGSENQIIAKNGAGSLSPSTAASKKSSKRSAKNCAEAERMGSLHSLCSGGSMSPGDDGFEE